MTSLAEFLGSFVRPLVAGGEVHIGGPVRPKDLQTWEGQLDGMPAELERIDEARAATAATIVVRPPPMLFDGELLHLALALYGALVLAHPSSEGWSRKRGRRELAGFSRALADVPAPETTGALVSRHALLARLFELTRRDTTVKWWTGSAEFRGAAPPARLLRWRGVRRVREQSTSVALGDILADDDGRATIGALLTASPLTDLLSLTVAGRRPAFRWGSQIPVLRDAELARAVGYRWLEDLGDTGSDRVRGLRAPAAAALAWEQALAAPLELIPRGRARSPELAGGDAVPEPLAQLPPRPSTPIAPSELRAATAFLVHLNVLCAMTETDASDLDAPSALISAALSAKRGDAGLVEATGARLFFCVPEVAGRCDPALARPAGLDGEPRLQRRWAAHRAQVRAAVGEERLAGLSRRLMVCV